MGSNDSPYPDQEGPPHTAEVAAFSLARHAVSNDDLSAFVAATGYLTTAEREGWSYVFGAGRRAGRISDCTSMLSTQ